MKIIIHLLVFAFIISSCSLEDERIGVEGMRPIYAPLSIDSIYAKGPLEMDRLGKIVYVEPFIFINERLTGIHVIDNNNPAAPENIAFWQILGNTDFTIESQYLYAENSRDLYTIDISDIHDIEVVDVIEDVYSNLSSDHYFPEDYFGDFECVSLDSGIVVNWKLDTLNNPKCWR